MDEGQLGLGNGTQSRFPLKLTQFGIGVAMQRYREPIFKYAILINVAVALYMIWQSWLALHAYAVSQELLATLDAGGGGFGLEPVRIVPRHVMIFGWVMIAFSLLLIPATLHGVWRGRAWSYWLRIFTYLAIWFAAWLAALNVWAELINFPLGWSWGATKAALLAAPVPVLASLWLMYNLRYRPLPPVTGAPSRYL